MPKEHRQRGKKHKKAQQPDSDAQIQLEQHHDLEAQTGPSWISRNPNATVNQDDAEAPFGYVDAEVKAYFRTVDLQIREWQDTNNDPGAEDLGDIDPNEERHLFFTAALREMSDKEKQLATDPDCSNILERMLYSMDDFTRRVFLDRLSGSHAILMKHRFASHVCQTLFNIADSTIAREARGTVPDHAEPSDAGHLRTLTQLILDICEEVLPVVTTLIMDPFGSHVIRALLALLCPNLFPKDQSSTKVRSKKSATYKQKQGTMKSVFQVDSLAIGSEYSKRSPSEFQEAAVKILDAISSQLDGNEVRALGANRVASPLLQMLLELEAHQHLSDSAGSLMDRVLDGLISYLDENVSEIPEPSDYVGTLLRDPTSSHLLETLVSQCPDRAFVVLWSSHFVGKLARLSVHPVANFVVAKALHRLTPELLSVACEELSAVGGKIVKSARIGVFRSLVERASAIHSQENAVLDLIYTAFDFQETSDRPLIFPCILRQLSPQQYNTYLQSAVEAPKTNTKEDVFGPKTQGALLLQSLLRLSPPHNQPVIDSLFSLPVDGLIEAAQDATASRVLDVLLDSPTVPVKVKRKFVLAFIGRYQILVDDRIGSRVGDRCWEHADPYLREKIARSLIPHEHTLAGSFYGKFFSRKLNLFLLQRNPDEWKNQQVNSKLPRGQAQALPETVSAKTVPIVPGAPPVEPPTEVDKDLSHKRKRKTRGSDEIDALFEKKLGKKVKLAELVSGPTKKPVENAAADDTAVADKTLTDTLGAIQLAPTKDRAKHGRKRKQ